MDNIWMTVSAISNVGCKLQTISKLGCNLQTISNEIIPIKTVLNWKPMVVLLILVAEHGCDLPDPYPAPAMELSRIGHPIN